MQKFIAFLVIVLIINLLQLVYGQETSEKKPEQTSREESLSEDEATLFNMLNDFRAKSKLPPLALSAALCKTAHMHIIDIIDWQPTVKGCSLHSWSDSPLWTGCCHHQDLAGMQCMMSKPKEIAGYPGAGYELIYWGNDDASPQEAAMLWQTTEVSADMLLARGKWKGFQWKAIGVGIQGGYAVIWLGDKSDKNNPVLPQLVKPSGNETLAKNHKENADLQSVNNKVDKIKPEKKRAKPGFEENQKVADNRSDPVAPGNEDKPRYYLIVASVKTSLYTKDELRRFKSKGFPDACVLKSPGMYRIALMSYESESKAQQKLRELKGQFPDIWVYKK